MTTTLQTVVDSMTLGSLYALFALGIALIFGIMRLVNFAHGELIMLAALAVVVLDDSPLVILVLGALLVPTLIALGMDRVVFRPVRDSSPTTMLVVSFGLSIGIQSLTQTIRGDTLPEGASVSSWLNERVTLGDIVISHLSIVTVLSVIVLVSALGAFLRFTPVGMQMRAAAEDFEVTQLMGVRANVVIATAFALSGFLAGVAGLLLMAQTGTWSFDMGLTPVIFGFVAAVLGGLGSLSGAVAAGYFIGAVSTTLQVTLPDGYLPFRSAFVFAVVLIVLVFRPEGLVKLRSMVTRV